MEAYTILLLKEDLKKVGKYVSHCYFLLFSIGMTTSSYAIGLAPVFDATNNFPVMLGITSALIIGGFFTVSNDLKKLKKEKKKIKISQIVIIAVFLYVSMYTEVIFFVVDHMILMVNVVGTEEMKIEGKRLGTQASIAVIFVLFNYPIFFKGKEIWKWITIRDKIIEQYETESLENNRIT